MAGSAFGPFLDLIFLIPIILAVRVAFPGALAFRLVCTLSGVVILYGYAPRFVPVIIAYWVIVWLLQYVAAKADQVGSKVLSSLLLATVVLLPLAPMIIWKLAPDAFTNAINVESAKLLWFVLPSFGFVDALTDFVVPLGLSFLTFRALDLLLKVYLTVLEPISLERMLYYGLYPPIQVLGPIAEYEEVRVEKVAARWPAASDLAVGAFRVAIGLIKIFAIGQGLERLAAEAWRAGDAPVPLLWLATLLYGLFFYANFSGYSEVAIGLSRMLGVKLKENFANPFLKTTPQDFWNSWHMSLTRWAQRYIFIPLGGMRAERQYFAIFATIMVIALWHGLKPTLIVFGVYHASIVVGHRYLQARRKARGLPPVRDGVAGRAAKSFLVLAYVSLSIPLLVLDSQHALAFYGRLVGASW